MNQQSRDHDQSKQSSDQAIINSLIAESAQIEERRDGRLVTLQLIDDGGGGEGVVGVGVEHNTTAGATPCSLSLRVNPKTTSIRDLRFRIADVFQDILLGRSSFCEELPPQQKHQHLHVKTFRAHTNWVSQLLLSRDGTHLYSSSYDYGIIRWNLREVLQEGLDSGTGVGESGSGATSLSATLTREAVLAMVDRMVAWNADRTHTKLPAQQTAPAKASATKDHKEILLNSKLAAFVDHGSGALGGGGGGAALPNTTVTSTQLDHSAAANKPEMGGNGISLGMTSATAPTSGGILPGAVGVSPPLLAPTSSVPGGSWCSNSIIHLVGPSHRGVPPGVVSPTSSLGGGHQSPSVLAGSSMNLGASASAMVRHRSEMNEGGACSTVVDEEAVVEQIDVIRQLSESAICSPSWARRLVEGSAASVSHKRKNAAEASNGANSKKMNSTKKKRTTSTPDDVATRSSRKTSASRTSGAASTTFGVASEWKPPGAFFPQEEQGLYEEEAHEDEKTPEDPVDEDDVEFVMTETDTVKKVVELQAQDRGRKLVEAAHLAEQKTDVVLILLVQLQQVKRAAPKIVRRTSAGISSEQRKADGVLACKFGGAFKPQAVYAMALDESASGPSSASSSASSGAAGSFPSSTQESHLYVASGLTVKKFETESKRFVGEYQGHHDYVIDVAISSRKMATVSDDMTAICTASGGGAGGAARDQDRSEVLGSQHNPACAAATTSPESVALEAQDNYRTIFACKFTRCGRFLFIVLAHVVKKWCTRTLTCVAKFEAPKNSRMINCCPSPCGSVLYVALQKSVVAFDAFNGEVLRHFHCEIGVVNNIAVA
eukprot:g15820.t1